jgi:hypothetical protein
MYNFHFISVFSFILLLFHPYFFHFISMFFILFWEDDSWTPVKNASVQVVRGMLESVKNDSHQTIQI